MIYSRQVRQEALHGIPMIRLFQSPRTSEFAFYFVVILVAVASWESQTYMQKVAAQQLNSRAAGGWVVVEKLSDVETKQLDAYLELNRLLTTLGTTMLGAVFFLMFDSSRNFVWKRRWWAAFLGTLFTSVSIFFGYVAYLFFISMLRDGNPNVTESTPHWAQQAHFYTFLLGVVFFADFMFHNRPKEDADGSKPNLQPS
jgi:hypothetical protein